MPPLPRRADRRDAGGERALGLVHRVRVRHRRQERLEEHAAARPAEVVGQHEQDADEIRDQASRTASARRRGRRRSPPTRPRAKPRAVATIASDLEPAALAPSRRRRPRRARRASSSTPTRAARRRTAASSRPSRTITAAIAEQRGRRRCRAARAGGGVAVRVVSVSRGSATTTVRVGSLGELLNVSVGVVAAVRDLGIGAEDEQEARALRVGVQEGRRRGVEHPLVEQVVLRLLLREGVEPAPRAGAAEKRHRVRRVHVVALPADADERDRRAANAGRGCRSSLAAISAIAVVPVDAPRRCRPARRRIGWRTRSPCST